MLLRHAWVLVRAAVDHWVAAVKPGRIVLEMAGVREDQAREALRLAAHKLPMKVQFVTRQDQSVG